MGKAGLADTGGQVGKGRQRPAQRSQGQPPLKCLPEKQRQQCQRRRVGQRGGNRRSGSSGRSGRFRRHSRSTGAYSRGKPSHSLIKGQGRGLGNSQGLSGTVQGQLYQHRLKPVQLQLGADRVDQRTIQKDRKGMVRPIQSEGGAVQVLLNYLGELKDLSRLAEAGKPPMPSGVSSIVLSPSWVNTVQPFWSGHRPNRPEWPPPSQPRERLQVIGRQALPKYRAQRQNQDTAVPKHIHLFIIQYSQRVSR